MFSKVPAGDKPIYQSNEKFLCAVRDSWPVQAIFEFRISPAAAEVEYVFVARLSRKYPSSTLAAGKIASGTDLLRPVFSFFLAM